MQAGDGGLNWAQVAGSVAACAAGAGAFLALLRIKQRRRELRNERPPQREKVLRPAGYSAMRRLEELADKLTIAVGLGIGAAVIFGLIAGTFYPIVAGLALGKFTLAQVWAAPRSNLVLAASLVGLLALLWSIRQFELVWRLEGEVRDWRFGLRGEQAVAEKLSTREVAAAGYVAFHDVPGDGKWNIDHVVVGPGGVFVLETKARARRKATRNQEEQEVIYDGRALVFPWCTDWGAVEQVERNCAWVRAFLAGFGPKGLVVQPAIVVPGWYVKSTGNYPVKGMNAAYLVGYLKGAKRIYTPEELEPVIRRFDERCRVLEF